MPCNSQLVRDFDLRLLTFTHHLLSLLQVTENAMDKASIMFVIPYRRLDSVQIRPPPTTPSSTPASSAYVEFLTDRWSSRRVLRFDRPDWATELVAEVAEAHFRFVQTAMTLNRVAMSSADLNLHNHPLALPFAPPVDTPAHFDTTLARNK